MTWATTASGRALDYLMPKPEQITLYDVTLSMSRNHRFAGFSPLKLAQHDIEVATLMMDNVLSNGGSQREADEAGLVGIIHDLPEYIVGDCPTPFKKLLSPMFAEIEFNLLQTFLTMWQAHELYAKWNDLLHECDALAVRSEAMRFGMDGVYLNFETGVAEKVPHRWVPEDVEILFNNAAWDQKEARMNLLITITKLLYRNNRQHLLADYDRIFEGDESQITRTHLPVQLLSGKVYL